MENVKLPYLPEETLKTQRVEIYLHDLKDRLNELRLRHDEVIHNSIEIIKEIDEVSSTLQMTPGATADTSERMTKIKKLILEFETTKVQSYNKSPVVVENSVDVRKMLQNFERLNDSQLLRNSLLLFHKAKESFKKIDSLLGVVEDQNKNEFKKPNISESIRDKINMLNQNTPQMVPETIVSPNIRNTETNNATYSEKMSVTNPNNSDFNDTCSTYASCCSSLTSIQRCQTLDNENDINVYKNYSFSGYEGDNDDSEFDMYSAKIIN